MKFHFLLKRYNKNKKFDRGSFIIKENIKGKQDRVVQLRLVVKENLEPTYGLINIFEIENDSISVARDYYSMNLDDGIQKSYVYELQQNYPNPFYPRTKISYSVKDNVIVTIKLYDMLGREVVTLLNEEKSPGEYELAVDAGKLGLSSGMYIYQMRAGEFSSIKKLVLVK